MSLLPINLMNNISEIKHLISNIKNFLQTSVWLMPVNYDEQKAKFLKSEIENPLFVYPSLPILELEKWLNELEKVEVTETGTLEGYFISRQVREIKLKLQLILKRDALDYFKIVQELYPCYYQTEYIAQAKNDVNFNINNQDKNITHAAEMSDLMRNYLEHEYQVSDWKIEITDRSDFAINVQPRYKNIFISKNFAEYDIDLLLAHEIDGHFVRALNMHNQTGYLARQFPLYLKTEEGLACFLSDFCSKSGVISRKKHAAKYLAGLTAQNHGFNLVYNHLRELGMSEHLAFRRTFRLKRGLSDTSKPGLFTKEAMYYEGMLEVKKYIDEGGDSSKLFAGKIGLEDLDKVTEFNYGIIPNRISNYAKYV